MPDVSGGARTAADHHEKELRIRERAYEFWVEEGRPEGRALDHWLRAKRELEAAQDPAEAARRIEAELQLTRERG